MPRPFFSGWRRECDRKRAPADSTRARARGRPRAFRLPVDPASRTMEAGGKAMKRRFIPAILGMTLAAAVPLFAGTFEPLPPVATVEEAHARLRHLREESTRVEAWVEDHCEEEFAERYPEYARDGKETGDTGTARKARDLKARIALSDLKTTMRAERRAWLDREMSSLLSQNIREDLSVRLGPYDADRGEYPLLIGFGWPSPLIVRMRVSERERSGFESRFPPAFQADFRINEKGEVLLHSLDWDRVSAETQVFLAPPEPRLLWENSHESWVTSVAVRSDGTQILSAGADGMICLWDVPTGNRIWRRPDVEMALSIAFSPDGSTFVTGAADSGIRGRDTATGKELWRESAAGMVFSVGYTPDGRHVVSGDDGGALQVRNARTGREILRADLGSPVRAIDVTSGGKTVLVGTEGKSVVLWEMVTGRQIWRKELDWPVYAVSAGDGLVAVSGGGNRLMVLRESDGVEVWNRIMDGEVRTVRFDETGRLVGAGGSGYSARVFLAESGKPVWSASVGSPVRSLAFGPRGMKLAVGSSDFGVRLFEVDEGDRILAAFCSYGRLYVDRKSVARIFRPHR